LLLRTGNLAAPVAAHMFCNSQGMPNFQRMLAHGPVVRAALGGGIAIFVALLVSANSAD
jgi:prenyl protein peptidase